MVFGDQKIPVRVPEALAGYVTREVVVGIRPQAFEADAICADRALPRIRVSVTGVEELGTERMVLYRPEGAETTMSPDFVYQARVSSRADVRAGQSTLLAIDPDAFYFFDPDDDRTLACPARPGFDGFSPVNA